MSWNIGENRNLFLKLKTKLGLYNVELRSKPKDSPEKNTLTLIDTQQLPDIETIESKDEISCLKWIIYNGRRKVGINFQVYADTVNIVVYRYRNNTYLKDTEMELKLIEYKKLLAKRVYLWSYIDIFYKRALYLMKQLFIFKTNSCLDTVVGYSKVFRIHAILKDAAGAVRTHSGKAPGYCYMVGPRENSCLLGHVTGLPFCLYVKLFLPSIFNSVDF